MCTFTLDHRSCLLFLLEICCYAGVMIREYFHCPSFNWLQWSQSSSCQHQNLLNINRGFCIQNCSLVDLPLLTINRHFSLDVYSSVLTITQILLKEFFVLMYLNLKACTSAVTVVHTTLLVTVSQGNLFRMLNGCCDRLQPVWQEIRFPDIYKYLISPFRKFIKQIPKAYKSRKAWSKIQEFSQASLCLSSV